MLLVLRAQQDQLVHKVPQDHKVYKAQLAKQVTEGMNGALHVASFFLGDDGWVLRRRGDAVKRTQALVQHLQQGVLLAGPMRVRAARPRGNETTGRLRSMLLAMISAARISATARAELCALGL